MRIYLFGYASDDFCGRVVVTPDERTVATLADQLVSWGLAPERGGFLTCAAHEWVFDARTGRGVNPASACLRRYPVRLAGDRIYVSGGQVE